MYFSSLLHSLLAAYACGACGASPDEYLAG